MDSETVKRTIPQWKPAMLHCSDSGPRRIGLDRLIVDAGVVMGWCDVCGQPHHVSITHEPCGRELDQ